MDIKDIQLLQKDATITKLKHENTKLNEIIEALKNHLEKYTNNERHKKYYEHNKEKVKENAKQYLNRLKFENPEKLKEYRHRAYLKRKVRISQQDVTSEISV
jgi:hypothetical protein